MNEILAFVGHSFGEDDAEICSRFLAYFDQVAKSHPHFSWIHAEEARPETVSTKVLDLLRDRNTFIGICTRKERVAQNAALKRSFWSNDLRAAEEAIEWKTSDWIIQEIGLAIGRELKIILFVEEGVRSPGGLQGAVEYIPFGRIALDMAFGKFLEMLARISPKDVGSTVMTAALQTDPATAASAAPQWDLADWKTPKPDWERFDYHIAFRHLTFLGETEAANRVSDGYLASADAGKGDNRNSWIAGRELTLLVEGKGGSLDRLKKIAEANPDSAEALKYLAQGFEHFQDYRQAAINFRAAAARVPQGTERVRLLGFSALAQLRDAAPEAAEVTIEEMRTWVGESGTGELELLAALREVAEYEKDKITLIALLERIVSLDPADNRARFSLAFEHAAFNNHELALTHYMKIPAVQRDRGTWNNLGVELDHFELSAKSVEAFHILRCAVRR